MIFVIYFLLGILPFLIPFTIGAVVYYCIIIKEYQKSEYFKITHIPYFRMRSDSGRLGEYYTYKYLTRLPGKKRFLFNCYIPDENDITTEIDVLLIHESGIYVFESKNYSGWIFGSENQKQWTQSLAAGRGKGKSRKKSFFNPIWQNKKHINWLQKYLKEYSSLPFYSYIVFSERCELKKLNLKTQEHVVIRRNNVLYAVSAQAAAVDSVLSQETIDKLYDTIYPLSQADSITKSKHIQNINNTQHQNEQKAHSQHSHQNVPVKADPENTSEKICPHCGGKLVLRTATKGQNAGKKFYGCSSYPKCRYIEKITAF